MIGRPAVWQRVVGIWAAACTTVGVGVAITQGSPAPEVTVSAGAPARDAMSATPAITAPEVPTSTTIPTTTTTAPLLSTTIGPARPTKSARGTTTTTVAAPPSSVAAAPSVLCPPVAMRDAPSITIPLPHHVEATARIGPTLGGPCGSNVTVFANAGGDLWRNVMTSSPATVRLDYMPTAEAWVVAAWWDGTELRHSVTPVPYRPLDPPQVLFYGQINLRYEHGELLVELAPDTITIKGGGLRPGWEAITVSAVGVRPTVQIKETATGQVHTVMAGRNSFGEAFALLDP